MKRLTSEGWPWYNEAYEYKHEWPQPDIDKYNTFFDIGDWWDENGGYHKDETAIREFQYDTPWHHTYHNADDKLEQFTFTDDQIVEPVIATYIPKKLRDTLFANKNYMLTDDDLKALDQDQLLNIIKYLQSQEATTVSKLNIARVLNILKDKYCTTQQN